MLDAVPEQVSWISSAWFRRQNLAGVDIAADRVRAVRQDLPAVDFQCESAEHMSYAAGTFEMVFESTMFVQITNGNIAAAIAADMLRVATPVAFSF